MKKNQSAKVENYPEKFNSTKSSLANKDFEKGILGLKGGTPVKTNLNSMQGG